MATVKQMAALVATLGALSFIFGIVAENKKPDAGTPVPGKGVTICNYPASPTVPLGFLSFVFLILSSAAGYLSVFYPYKGKSVPQTTFFKSTTFLTFFNITLFNAVVGATFLLWPTIEEVLHLSHKVHNNLHTNCPTAKTGLLGGGAFLSLNASLFWLVSLMLADNAREDYFEEAEKDFNGGFGQATSDYEAIGL